MGVCMKCCGDEDVSNIRPVATKLSSVSVTKVGTNDAPSIAAGLSTVAVSGDASQGKGRSKAEASCDSLDGDYSSYSGRGIESTSRGTAIGGSLYSEEISTGWVPFFGFGGMKTESVESFGSDDVDFDSESSGSYSFAQSTRTPNTTSE